MAVMASFAAPVPAFAYQDEVPPGQLQYIPMAREFMADPDDPSTWTIPDPMPCVFCHGTAAPTSADSYAAGPHGGYLSTTNKCATCHSVHDAPAGSELLLPAATVKATCEVCHDGTGGKGVYGALVARGLPDPAVSGAVHSIDVTNVIPGGTAADGTDDSTRSFAGVAGALTCTDCHSPHGTSVVNPFAGDRARSAGDAAVANTVTSTRLLKQRPSTAAAATTEYGSDWCGGCHTGRLSGSGPVGNHPVESSFNPPEAGGAAGTFYYGRIARVTGVGSSATEIGTLGHNNFGYVMPDPRTTGAAGQEGHAPICQQCHEDARTVGNVTDQQIDAGEVFAITQVDGAAASDSPQFQNFPHESQNFRFLVEAQAATWEDDLCLNCHNPAILN